MRVSSSSLVSWLTASVLVSSSLAFSVGSKAQHLQQRSSAAAAVSQLYLSDAPSPMAALGQPTELPDSLEDGAQIAAQACSDLIEAQGVLGRCRVDFDTSAGDETFTLLKQSIEFMQVLVTSLCYLQMPGLQIQKQNEMMKVVNAQAEMAQLKVQMEQLSKSEETSSEETTSSEESEDTPAEEAEDPKAQLEQKMGQLQQIINTGGRDPNYQYEGPICRIYFPDEGNAALARRDWLTPRNGAGPLVPPCVQFASCGGVQREDISNDQLIFFFCPRASESESVEELLLATETKSNNLQLTTFVNPILVDMGVTGFGMAGRLLRERLIDPLPNAYYLRTLQWGALTRVWPREFSVWQEDEDADGGYRLIKTQGNWPSNPEVEDIYDIENGNMDAKKSGGPLDALGDFVNGMMRL